MILTLLGPSGVGKTTLFNKLCNTNYASGVSKSSLTRGLFRSYVSHGNHSY